MTVVLPTLETTEPGSSEPISPEHREDTMIFLVFAYCA